ncbi:MAG: Ig-like domain-containing protein [Pyrinomonadaceae bacterium]
MGRHLSSSRLSLRAGVGLCLLSTLLGVSPAAAQSLNQNCVVSVLNRNVQVNADGTWVLPNVPAGFGQVRARATCVENGVTRSGQSDFFTVSANRMNAIPPIILGSTTQIPVSLTITPAAPALTAAGQTSQLLVTANYPDNSTGNVTAGGAGTTYTTSNPAIATISADGLVTAVSTGTIVIQATNDGASGIISASVVLSSADSDADGIPDDVEVGLGLDPSNPVDAQEDFDRDNLTNLQEFTLGTGLRNRDTDGDGLSDGDEVNRHLTSPLVADTDGDGIPDGIEVQTGTNPLDPGSFDLARALRSIEVTPGHVTLVVNTIIGEASQQLTVTGHLTDGKTTLNLTARSRGTNYASANLAVANFGAEDGIVFAGGDGSTIVTATNSGFSATTNITVSSFAPTAVSFVSIPGFANNVDVSGNFAYVAAGSAGLQVVNVTDRRAPRLVGSLDTPGNANDVRAVGNRVYVADGSAGLRIIDVSNPAAPTLLGALDTEGEANDVVVVGDRAYVAGGTAGLQIINVSNPQTPTLLGTFLTDGIASGVDVSGNTAVVAVSGGSGGPELAGRGGPARTAAKFLKAGFAKGARVRANAAGFAITTGVQTVNVSNPATPVALGSLETSDARDVAVDGSVAYLADFTGSLKVIDFSDPAAPQLLAETDTSLGGILTDVAKSREFVFGADVFFVNGVPIINVGVPASPLVRARLDFPARDDNGTGVAVDNTYVYLTADPSLQESGEDGDSRLYIGQYVALEDKAGVPPAVSITSPAAGATVIQGATLPITVQATDDVQVAAVDFLVNGNVVFTDSAAPYQFDLTVPLAVSTLTLGARAVDVGNNVALAQTVQLNVIPDPKTTVAGRVVDNNSNPVPGALVTIGQQAAITGSDGAFSIPQVPTIFGNIAVTASATVNGVKLRGRSAGVAPVPGGVTSVGDIVVREGRLYGVAFSGSRGSSTLYSIDESTGAATAIGPVGFQAVSAMDFDSSGKLYAVGRRPADRVSVLITINTATGVGTEVGPTRVEELGFGDSVADISFRPSDGVLYAYLEAGDGLGTINKLTGEATALGPSGANCCGNGMAFSPEGVLFHSNDNSFNILNQLNGLATVVAPMTFPPPADDDPRINGMSFQPGTGILFASLNDGSAGAHENYLVRVNVSNGVVTIIGPTVGGLDALAFGP